MKGTVTETQSWRIIKLITYLSFIFFLDTGHRNDDQSS